MSDDIFEVFTCECGGRHYTLHDDGSTTCDKCGKRYVPKHIEVEM